MGKFNSSLTRVKPLFDRIDSDCQELNKLFSLFNSKITPIMKNSSIEIRYGENEIKIPASKSMLIWMLKNHKSLNNISNHGSSSDKTETYKKRELLFSGDKNILNVAINAIESFSELPDKKWYVLEGKTSPDIYIETHDSIYIGEAKRTEKYITTKTLWLNERDQLIRHVDSLLDQPKKVYSFYLLEKKNFKGHYEEKMTCYTDKKYWQSNLKHRDNDAVERALNSFIGFLFWEDIANHFNINFPDTI
jgi:hypothetical protein